MANEPKGPYKLKDGIKVDGNDFIYVESEIEVEIANAAYADGYKAGRASREGLRETLQAIASELYVNVESATRCRQIAKQALAEDEKEGK